MYVLLMFTPNYKLCYVNKSKFNKSNSMYFNRTTEPTWSHTQTWHISSKEKEECASILWTCDELSNFKLCIQTDRLLIVNLLYTNNLILYIEICDVISNIHITKMPRREWCISIVRITFDSRNREQYWNVLDHNFIKICIPLWSLCTSLYRIKLMRMNFINPFHLERLHVQCTVGASQRNAINFKLICSNDMNLNIVQMESG